MGSSSYITDREGRITQHTEYIAFGEVLFEEHSTSKTMPYLFNGKELDTETELYYYGARYYDPRVSLWLNVDPLAEKTMTPYAYTNNNPIMLVDPDGRSGEDPPISFGFRIGVSIGIGSNGINFNAGISAGVQYRTPNFQAVAFASANVYGGQQLGTSYMTKGVQYDLTAGAYASIGNGTGTPHNFYTLNYNTPSPFDNTFDMSLTYGQARTFNSAINHYGDGPGWQTQGIIGARFGNNFSFSTNNDAKIYGTALIFNDTPTDAGWTGGIVLNLAGIEAGYQNFSGYWPEFGSAGKEYGYIFSSNNRSIKNGEYHESLNRAFNFVRKGSVTGGVFSKAWLQNWIHKNFSNDGTYIYNNQGNVNISSGK